MRIIIKEPDGRNINIRLPSRIVFNRITAVFAPMVVKNRGIHFTRKQALHFIKAINSARRKNPGWKLVEIESSEGQHVEIQL